MNWRWGGGEVKTSPGFFWGFISWELARFWEKQAWNFIFEKAWWPSLRGAPRPRPWAAAEAYCFMPVQINVTRVWLKSKIIFADAHCLLLAPPPRKKTPLKNKPWTYRPAEGCGVPKGLLCPHSPVGLETLKDGITLQYCDIAVYTQPMCSTPK